MQPTMINPNPSAVVEEQAPALPPMTARDRCDSCGAQAYVIVTLRSGDLMFCGHDYAKHEPALAAVATNVRDERHRLLDSYNDVEATELDS